MLSTFLAQVCRRGILLPTVACCNINGLCLPSSYRRLYQCKEHQVITARRNLQIENVPKIIYKFPFIRLARAFCRLKIYQTLLTGLIVPASGYLAYVGSVGIGIFAQAVFINGFACLMLYVMGEIFRRIVGHIYYNAGNDLVKVSHLTFWGGRKDIEIPATDIVPLADAGDNSSDIYVHLRRYSQPDSSLFLCLRFGGIVEYQTFSHVFGSLHPEEQMKGETKQEE